MSTIAIPEFCLLLLVGPSGSGKTTFARTHFSRTEILSADAYRGLVSDDDDLLEATDDAFAVIHEVVRRRLRRRLLTVVDATNLNPLYRRVFVDIARECYAPCVAIVLDVSEATCRERNRLRTDVRPRHVVHRHLSQARGMLKTARREGFSHVHALAEDEVAHASFLRERLWTDRRHEAGPFDIVGDVHGCLEELLDLVTGPLGYAVVQTTQPPARSRFSVSHPQGRRLISVGDLVDRGPDSVGVLRFWMDAVESGTALAIKGNHDAKLARHMRGQKVSEGHGFARTLEQMVHVSEEDRRDIKAFLDSMTSHMLLDGGALAVAHAGVKADMQGKAGRLVSEFCLYGETNGETDEFGLQVRHDWAAGYGGKACVVYGHVPSPQALWVGNTICIDTGCVFGGSLTALRWPEREVVCVSARAVHSEPLRPLASPVVSGSITTGQPGQGPTLPDAALLTAKAVVQTRYGRPVLVRPEQAAAAFEILARNAADPRWLIHVPPTTATVEASGMPDWLERPEEAFAHYAKAGLKSVCIQEKHMGSRAVVIACRDAEAARLRFADGTRQGVVLSKSGRPFFADPVEEAFIVQAVAQAMDRSGLWQEMDTSWVVLDGEMLPWNAKAGSLIRETFAATGSAGAEEARAAAEAFGKVAHTSSTAQAELQEAVALGEAIASFRRAYGHFVTPYRGMDDLRYAPFHVLASERVGVHAHLSHAWHMQMAERLALASPGGTIIPTVWQDILLDSVHEREEATRWWEAITQGGHEGIIVKGPSLALLPGGVAPSIKVRGRDYLRIIYGPRYDRADILPGLKKRATSRKRSLARVETALGLESLARFAEGASMARVHEVVAASLAMACEPVDSRL
jgi:protein phosphatase